MKRVKILTICIMATSVLLSAGCGRKGPLLPPEALVPARVNDLSVQQKGARLVISWTPPNRQVGGASLREPTGFVLSRREVLPPAEDCEECPSAYRTVSKVSPGDMGNARRSGGRLYIDDTEVDLLTSYQYYVTSVLSDGTASPPSNRARRTVHSPPAPPVIALSEAPVGFELVWSEPSAVDSGGELSGYNIYRRKNSDMFPPVPLNRAPVRETRYEDLRLEAGQEYHYAVRTVARIQGEEVESALSNEVTKTYTPDR